MALSGGLYHTLTILFSSLYLYSVMVLMLFSSSKSSVAGGKEPKIQGKSFFQSSFREFPRNFPIGPYRYPHKAHIHVKTFIKIKISYRSHFKISCNLKHTYFLKGLTNWVSLLCPLYVTLCDYCWSVLEPGHEKTCFFLCEQQRCRL